MSGLGGMWPEWECLCVCVCFIYLYTFGSVAGECVLCYVHGGKYKGGSMGVCVCEGLSGG